jgi:hypothetical protein
MAWTYQSFQGDNGPDSAKQVIAKMQACLAGLSPATAAMAKTGLTDHHKSSAFGVVFYKWDAPASAADYPTGAWNQYTVTHTDNSQYDQNYQTILNILNGNPPKGAPTLSQDQALYAHFAMSDVEGGLCHMVLFYPST